MRGSEALSGAYLLARLQAGGLKPAEGNYLTARKTHRPKPRLRDSVQMRSEEAAQKKNFVCHKLSYPKGKKCASKEKACNTGHRELQALRGVLRRTAKQDGAILLAKTHAGPGLVGPSAWG